mgnify:FL=1
MKIDTTWLLSLMLIKKKNSYDELFVTTNEYEFIKDILNKNYKVELENDINTYFIKLENDKYIINKENLNGVWELENLYNYIMRNSKTTFELDLIELKKIINKEFKKNRIKGRIKTTSIEITPLEDILKKIVNEKEFYKKISSYLKNSEKEDIKSHIKKSCDNCENKNCNYKDNNDDSCELWNNDIEIGKIKVLGKC